MSGGNGYFDPWIEIREFYQSDNPTEEEQFRFVEAMEKAIAEAVFEDDIIASSFNLAMYYRDIQNFRLEKKYLEIGAELNSSFSVEQLGFLWYYGLCDEPDYQKAFQYFTECRTRKGRYMLADMYHYGRYVEKDDEKCRCILEKLRYDVEDEKNDSHFVLSTLFPEIAVRLARLNIEEEIDSEEDWEDLIDARRILTIRQGERPFWGNIKTMRYIQESIKMLIEEISDFVDLYDLMIFDATNAVVEFDYKGTNRKIEIFEKDGEVVYQYEDRWFHGADDFLEKAEIDGKKITSEYRVISNIEICK